MSAIIEYWGNLRTIELEIVRKGIALGIDWNDHVQLRALAHEALAHHAAQSPDNHPTARHARDRHEMVREELFGLAALMLCTMEHCALDGFLAHGGDVWKAFAQALWIAREQQEQTG